MNPPPWRNNYHNTTPNQWSSAGRSIPPPWRNNYQKTNPYDRRLIPPPRNNYHNANPYGGRSIPTRPGTTSYLWSSAGRWIPPRPRNNFHNTNPYDRRSIPPRPVYHPYHPMALESHRSQYQIAGKSKLDLADGSRSDFASRLAAKLLIDGDKNVVFSPASIHAVVSLIAAGASGATLDQTLAFLNLKSKEELMFMYQNIVRTIFDDNSTSFSTLRLSFVNGLWLDQSMKLQEPFKKIACGAFKAFAQEVDFQSKAEQVRQEVNSWAEKETHGLIKDILPYGIVNETSRLILANSIYFKGSWANKFEARSTVVRDFHTLDSKTVRVPFMTTWQRQYISEFDGFKVLQLYYEGDYKRSFSMIIFLPDAKDGLKSLIERMGSEPGFLDKYVPVETVKVGKFMLPKFKISYELELSKDLKDMGLNLPFDRLGGLMEMVTNPVDGKELVVSRVFHKTFIEVDEEGTTAAAATLALIACGCGWNPVPEKSFDFVADHPFAFVIKEKESNDVLFAGSVVNPL